MLLFVVIIGKTFSEAMRLLKTGGRLIQKCQIIVKIIGRILYRLLNTGGRLFQVVIRAGLTVVTRFNDQYSK